MRWVFSLVGVSAGLCLAAQGRSDPSSSTQPARASHEADTFDLAVVDLDVTQVSSTPMFREVQVRCQVENRGPEKAESHASVVLTRSSEDGDKVLNTVPLPVPFPSGNFVTVVGTTSAWSAANVPYRCAIAFDGDGSDIDPSDDADEVTFPKQ